MEGPFTDAIDWDIHSTIEQFNSLPLREKVQTFDQIGVVAVRFYNLGDSIERKKEGNFEEIIIPHFRCQFLLTSQWRLNAVHIPPSFYFIRNGTAVVIYAGLERFTRIDEAALKYSEGKLLTKLMRFT